MSAAVFDFLGRRLTCRSCGARLPKPGQHAGRPRDWCDAPACREKQDKGNRARRRARALGRAVVVVFRPPVAPSPRLLDIMRDGGGVVLL